MGVQRVENHSAKPVEVHSGWLQIGLPSPPTADAPPPEPADCYLPADDPCLTMLIDRLMGDFPSASDVTFFAGDTDWSGAHSLKHILHERGWLLIARHRLTSHRIVTEHRVIAGLTTCGPLPPDVCRHLTTCSFDRSGSIEIPDTIVTELTQQARLLNPYHARTRHQQRVKAEGPRPSQGQVPIADLDRRLDAIERQAAKLRKRIAAIPFKTAEYQALDHELTTIVQEFHSTLRQRRTQRLQRSRKQSSPAERKNPAGAEMNESLEPLVIICWRLEP